MRDLTEKQTIVARLLIDAATLINDRESQDRVASAWQACSYCEAVQVYVKNPHETYTEVIIDITYKVDEDEDEYEVSSWPELAYSFIWDDGVHLNARDVSHEAEPEGGDALTFYPETVYPETLKTQTELHISNMLYLFASMTDEQWTAYNSLCDQDWKIPGLEAMTRRAALAALGLLPASYLAEFVAKFPDLLHWFTDYLHVLGV
jgi:hypothetical protein